MTTFIVPDGATVYDICLNTYQSLDYLVKLMTDNGIDGIDTEVAAGTEVVFDETLVLNKTTQNLDIKYATK
jgi:hypothetical protein